MNPATARALFTVWKLLALLLLSAMPAVAQDNYPARPNTLIVPYAAGGSIDLVARILAEGLTTRLGQTVVVDDRPCGNGVIAVGAMVKANPPAYTEQMGVVGAN